MLSELDARRPADRRLRPETVAMLAAKFSDFGDQYLIFSEFPDLNDASIVAFLQTVTSLSSISKRLAWQRSWNLPSQHRTLADIRASR